MKKLPKLLLLTLPLLVIAACGGGGDDLPDRLDLADPVIRMVNADSTPAAETKTLYRGTTVQSGTTSQMQYPSASEYMTISATETNTWDVRNHTSNTSIGMATIIPNRGTKYTLVALPTIPPGGSNRLINIGDPYNKSVTSNDARVRIANAAPLTAPLQLYMTDPNNPPSQTQLDAMQPTIPGAAAYGQAAPVPGANSSSLAGGRYRMLVVDADTDPTHKTIVLAVTVDIPANADWLITLIPPAPPAIPGPNVVRALVKPDGLPALIYQ